MGEWVLWLLIYYYCLGEGFEAADEVSGVGCWLYARISDQVLGVMGGGDGARSLRLALEPRMSITDLFLRRNSGLARA